MSFAGTESSTLDGGPLPEQKPPLDRSTCVAQEVRCAGTKRREVCEQGRWSSYDCGGQSTCKQGLCVGYPCQDNSRRCLSGDTYELCTQNTWKLERCPSGKTCEFGLCTGQPQACTDGQSRCAGAASVELCNNSAWQPAISCPAGQVCTNGGCQGSGCQEGARRCDDAMTSAQCGKGKWQKTPCAPGQTCTGDRCQATAFSCTLPTAQPKVITQLWQHPKAPYAGQTVTLSLRSDKVNVNNAPPLTLELINRTGKRTIKQYAVIGGTTLYYMSAAGLTAGENCLIVRDGSRVEAALKVIARDPGAGLPRGNGPWKVTRNHQWTCSEQPTNGNFLRVKVVDENGKPLSGIKVRIDWTEDTVFPIKPGGDFHTRHPRMLTTNKDGKADLWTPLGEGIRSPIDSKPGWLVYLVSIDGGGSDVATEITTGIWESLRQPGGNECNFCNRGAVNVYGHWSYSIEFKRTPTATQICDIPTDHAGQKGCAFYFHAYHEDGKPSCVPLAP